MTVEEKEQKLAAIDARIAEVRWLAATLVSRLRKLEAAREVHRVDLAQSRVRT